MTAQVKTRTVSFKSVMRTAAFMRGVREARKGLPMDYDAYDNERNTDNRWNYERGRQFGLLYVGPVKDGGRVRWDAIYALREALGARHIR
jgi:hypothetical protein